MVKLAKLPVLLGLVAALLLLSAGPGRRLGLWEYGTGFLLMRVAFFTGAAAALLAIILFTVRRAREGNMIALTLAVLLGATAAWIPWNGLQTARALPFIHDVTTDTNNPPAFVAVRPLRADAPNPPEYAGEEVARLQREGYPDIKPLHTDQPREKVYEDALQTAREQGWDIVAAVPEDGRIEATDTTTWFGFKDDVVIRVASDGDGSRVDIRSKSRVGGSDVGANAERIRGYLAALEARLSRRG
jgi:uncharacterized protein (DUF1499 family)